MKSVPRLIVALVLAWLCPVMAAESQGDFNLSEIAEGIYLHQGVTVAFEHPRHDDVANIGFVVGDQCVAVVDTGGSLAIGRGLREAIRETTKTPICFVINTHVHPDHTLGNAAFIDDDPVFVGHVNLPPAFKHNQAFFSDNFAEDLENRAAEEVLIPPDRLVSDTQDLDLGGRLLRLTALGKGHTDQDLSVLDLETGTLWLGSLFNQRVPAIDGSATGWVDIMEQLQAIPAQRVVPGNGPAPAPWPETADAQQRYLRELIAGVRKILAENGYLEEALTSVGQSERQHWLLFEQHHGANVTRVYTDLEWE